MKKKLLAIIALVACVATLFTACGKDTTTAIYQKAEMPVSFTDEGTKALTNVENFSIDSTESKGDFVVFTKQESPATPVDYTAATWSEVRTTKTVIYNVKTDKSVAFDSDYSAYTFDGTNTTKSQTSRAFEIYGDYVVVIDYAKEPVVVSTNTEPDDFTDEGATSSANATVYNANADVVITKALDKAFDINNADCFKAVNLNGAGDYEGIVIEDDFYRIVDGTLSNVAIAWRHGAVNLTSTNYVVRGDYAFLKSNTEVKVYNLNSLTMVNRYFIPADAVNSTLVYFNNGSFLIQTARVADPTTSDYDALEVLNESQYYFETVKVVYETKLVDVEGDESDVDCNYILGSAVYAEDYEDYEFGEYEAKMSVSTKFEDQRLISFKPITLAFDEDGDVIELEDVIDNQYSDVVITKFDNGNYIVTDINYISYLYDAEDELIGAKKLGTAQYGKYFKVGNKFIDAETFIEYDVPEGYEFDSNKSGKEVVLKKVVKDIPNANSADGTYTETFTAILVDGVAKDLYSEKVGYVPATATTISVMHMAYSFGYVEITTDSALPANGSTVKVYGWDGTLLTTIANAYDLNNIKTVGDYYVVEVSVLTLNLANPTETKTVFFRVG